MMYHRCLCLGKFRETFSNGCKLMWLDQTDHLNGTDSWFKYNNQKLCMLNCMLLFFVVTYLLYKLVKGQFII